MAHIRKLGERRYQARCVDPDGRECSKISSRRTDAEDKIKEVEHSKLDGSYIDHKNPITVAQYAKQWSTTRPHRSTTATRVKSLIDNHIAGTRLGGRRLSAVRTSEVHCGSPSCWRSSPRCRLPATNRADRVAAYARREAAGCPQ